MSKIEILHLSDIHCKGQKGNITNSKIIMNEMIHTIEKHMKEYQMEVDVVAITGDIAFSGKKREYNEAHEFFVRLQKVLTVGTQFLVVPGNHDVDRVRVSSVHSLHDTVKDKRKLDKLLETPKEIGMFILPKFKAFRIFANQVHPGLYASPKDYFWVKEFPEKNISILGLNSSWACESSNDRGNITLGYTQVINAFRQSNSKNKILLMHHPFDWFNEKDFYRYRNELLNNCSLILHGHTHFDNAMVTETPSTSCICLGANASYTKGKSGFIGFQFIRMEIEPSQKTVVTVWPFKLDDRDGLRFENDYSRWKGQNGKPYFRLEIFKSEPVTENDEVCNQPLKIPGEYREWVKKFHSNMEIDQLSINRETNTLSLPKFYIPIETANPFYPDKPNWMTKKEPGKMVNDKDVEEVKEEYKNKDTIDIEELVGLKKCILLQGGAGTGKTTLIKHLAYSIIQDICPDSLKGYLPVMIFLKDFWLIYNQELLKTTRLITFEELMPLYLEKSCCGIDWAIIYRFLKHQNVLFLIDGVDEIPKNLHQHIVGMIARFQFANRKNRFLMTGRPHGIKGPVMTWFGDNLHEINPLDDKKVRGFIEKWFQKRYSDPTGDNQLKVDDMLAALYHYDHITVFIRNPLLLTALCIFYQDSKQLPSQQAHLYDKIILNMVNRRFYDYENKGRKNEVLDFLMRLAFETHNKNRKTIEVSDALDALKQVCPKKREETDSQYNWRIDESLNEIEPACGLFKRRDSNEFEFTHLTFQEFLAGRYMVCNEKEWTSFLELYLDLEWWEETLLFFLGLINLKSKKKSSDIVEKIFNEGHTFMAVKALCRFNPKRREERIVSLTRKRLYQIMKSDNDLNKRFQAGVLIGNLGDIRLFEDKDNMVKIPAGEFVYGSGAFDNNKPIQHIFLDSYMMGIYTVTNQEFKRFIEDGGYQKNEFWTPEGWKWRDEEDITEPGQWHEHDFNGPNFPVVSVSWYEAVAYANWLSKVSGKPFRLPSEEEWEKAARGTDGRIFPWGNKFEKNFCNSNESGLSRTSPVGIFPEGASPYGCMDMVGNVFEWCADYVSNKSGEIISPNNTKIPGHNIGRVIRGGNWTNGPRNCSCTSRLFYRPTNRFMTMGFRVAMSL